MKWVKRLLILLAGLLLASVLLLVGAVLFLEESQYKRLLSWGAEQLLDSELLIEGPLMLDISRDLTLTSGGIQLTAHDNSYQLLVGRLFVNFRLGSYLQTGSFWFNNLELQDIDLQVTESSVDDDDFSFEDLTIPPVLIGQANFNNLKFSYQELPPGTLHKFSLDELILEELGEKQPISLRASGLFKGKPFKLEGKVDSIAQLLERQDPLSVMVALTSEPININLQGSIAEPLEGRGLDLKVEADISQVREIIEIVWDEIPILGSLQTSLSVRGDYNAPRLEAIDLHLQRGQEVDVNISGSVADVLNVAGFDLQLEAISNNPKVLSWLLFKKYEGMQTIQVSGKLQGEAERFSLQDFNALAETSNGVKLQVNGNAEVQPEGYRVTQADAGLIVKFNAPSTDAANLMDLEEVPELGPISGSLGLALSRDAVGIYNFDIEVGSSKQSQIKLNGDVGYVPLAQDLNLPELNLQTDIQIAALAKLGKQFDVELPALGPARLRGLLITQGSEILLQDARLNIGKKDQLILNASGLLATQLSGPNLENIRLAMDLDAQATELARLGKQFDVELPALGPVQLRSKLVTKGPELLLQSTRLIVGTDEESILQANGMVGIQIRDPSKFRVAMDVGFETSDVAQLAKQFEVDLPKLGAMHVTGWLESKGPALHVEDITIVAGATNQPALRANGRITTELRDHANSVDIEYDVALAPLVAAFSDLQPGNLGHLQGDAVIADLDGTWGIESFSVTSTKTTLFELQLSGHYDDMEDYNEAQIISSLSINSPIKLGEVLGIDLAGLGSFRQHGEVVISNARLRYDGKASLGRTNSTTKFSGYIKEGTPVFNGSLEMPILYLTDFGLGTALQDEPELPPEDAPTTPYVFSREPLNLDFLKEFNFDFVLDINKVESGDLSIDSVDANLKLNNGHLTGPLHLKFEGGKTEINVDIHALAVPEYRFSIIADDLTLGPLMAQVTEEVPIEGYSNLNVNLNTHGNTAHELASNLSGDLDFGLENARIPRKYIDLLFVDTLGWALSATMARKSHANLNCIMMTFGINHGEVRSETILADGQNISIAGQIDMDLSKETLDIVLLPKQKKRVLSSSTPVKIQGPMKNPKFSAIPAKAAAAEIGTMTLFSPVFIPLRLGEAIWRLMSDGDKLGGGCANVEQLQKASK